jgi:hypothetical protein
MAFLQCPRTGELVRLLAFLSRPQLGQFALRIGNRRFAKILQTFLHKYVRHITFGWFRLSTSRKITPQVFLWQSDDEWNMNSLWQMGQCPKILQILSQSI